jgi:hypothetical protein
VPFLKTEKNNKQPIYNQQVTLCERFWRSENYRNILLIFKETVFLIRIIPDSMERSENSTVFRRETLIFCLACSQF